MRLSEFLLPTERQPPGDAEALSHKLMVRAGLVRQLGAGLWTWMPAGWRVHQKVEQIIREEMDAIGTLEMLMPLLQPAGLWRTSGRYAIDELLKLHDRRDAELVLALSHEESVTTHVAQVVRSYRQLPLALYHFQIKERDEPRPRAGVLRTREFVMKDAYTFDRDAEAMDVAYEKQRGAYHRVFARCGLDFYECESDVGMMGGIGAHEFMAPCPTGENDVVLGPGYSANLEVASADPQPVPAHDLPSGDVHTPGATTIADVTAQLGVPAGALLKAFPVVTESRGLVNVFVRGDHRVNPVKLANTLGEGFRPAHEEELAGPPGFLGPTPEAPSLFDEAIVAGRYVAGANRVDEHTVVEVEPGERVDVRTVEPGDTIGGEAIRIEPAIEVGNIFKLGTRYSDPLGATFLDEDGREQHIWMGCYGIGPARIAAAAVEQYADEQGISWPKSIAPWDVEVVAVGKDDTGAPAAATALYEELAASGLEVLLDDRNAGPGEKFADAELLGVPLRITVGKRALGAGAAEAQIRRGRADVEGGVPLTGAAGAVRAIWEGLP